MVLSRSSESEYHLLQLRSEPKLPLPDGGLDPSQANPQSPLNMPPGLTKPTTRSARESRDIWLPREHAVAAERGAAHIDPVVAILRNGGEEGIRTLEALARLLP